MQEGYKSIVTLGEAIAITDVVAVARYGAEVVFSQAYRDRVTACRALVEKFSEEERAYYGITTGLGANWNKVVSAEERAAFQRNVILSHAAAVGEPLNEECVRAMMLILVQHLGGGYSGIRLETVETLRQMLNAGIYPRVPRHGSVGYIGVEGHIASVMIGEGQAWFRGELLDGRTALARAGIAPTVLEAKEGLSLISGTTSVTALAALAAHDARTLALSADVSGAMALEVLKGTTRAMDARIMSVRPHPNQAATAANIRKILAESEIQKHFDDYRVQDALSLRCMPQLHGASKKLIADGLDTLAIELNSSVDNPLVFPTEDGAGIALMGCNADGSYAGTVADTLCIAVANLAKMSERRLDRMVNRYVSELPAFLSSNPGVNMGYMIQQYTTAGIMGELRLMAHPATVDNSPTCAFQEDYVSMGYNAALKAYHCVEVAKYVFATEILFACQAQDFYEERKPAPATRAVYDLVRAQIPFLEDDRDAHGEVEWIADAIVDGSLLGCVEAQVGTLAF